jgi:hypothetical protein
MRSRNHGPYPGHMALRHPFACIPSARRLTHWHSPPQDAAATHLHLGLGRSTPRNNVAHAARYANCGRAKQGTKAAGTRGTSRRLVEGLEAAAGAYALTSSMVPGTQGDSSPPPHLLEQAPRGLRHRKPLERGHPTRRASAGGESPPQTGPLLSVRGREWVSNLFETPHTIHSQPSGRCHKF